MPVRTALCVSADSLVESIGYLTTLARMSLSRRILSSLPLDLDVAAGVLAVEDFVADLHAQRRAGRPLSRSLPGPTASTLPRCGFCLAVSGSRMPPAVFSSASSGSTTTRSSRGRSCHHAFCHVCASFGVIRHCASMSLSCRQLQRERSG